MVVASSIVVVAEVVVVDTLAAVVERIAERVVASRLAIGRLI